MAATHRRQGLVVLFLVCQLVFVVVATPDNDEDDDATNDTHNAEDTMIGCYMRSYTYRISKPFIREDGTELECYDDAVTVFTCWGRCDSNEIADIQPPYRRSNHPVCTYSGRHTRTVRLANCHPDHPQPEVEVFDAVACHCVPCTGEHTSCENIG